MPWTPGGVKSPICIERRRAAATAAGRRRRGTSRRRTRDQAERVGHRPTARPPRAAGRGRTATTSPSSERQRRSRTGRAAAARRTRGGRDDDEQAATATAVTRLTASCAASRRGGATGVVDSRRRTPRSRYVAEPRGRQRVDAKRRERDHDERRREHVDEAQAAEARIRRPPKTAPKITRTTVGRTIAAQPRHGLAEQQLRLGAGQRAQGVHDGCSLAVGVGCAAGQGDERVVEAGLLDAQVVGDDLVAGEDRGDGGERGCRVPVTTTRRPAAGRRVRTSGRSVEQAVVERRRRPEPEALLGVDAGDEPGRACRARRPGRASMTATRSQSRSASSMKWVTSRTVTPRSRIALDELPRVAAGLRVEPGRQLVEDGDLRVADEGERDRQPLLLAAGELAERRVRACSVEPEVVEELASGRPGRGRRTRTGRAPRGPCSLLGQLALLELDADAARAAVAVAPRVEAEHADGARRRACAEPADALDGGGLAGAVRPEDRRRSRPPRRENETSSTRDWSP